MNGSRPLLSMLQNDFEVAEDYQEDQWPERGNEEIGNRNEENEIYLCNNKETIINNM